MKLSLENWLIAKEKTDGSYKAYWHSEGRLIMMIVKKTSDIPTTTDAYSYYVEELTNPATAQTTFDERWTNRASLTYTSWNDILNTGAFEFHNTQ